MRHDSMRESGSLIEEEHVTATGFDEKSNGTIMTSIKSCGISLPGPYVLLIKVLFVSKNR